MDSCRRAFLISLLLGASAMLQPGEAQAQLAPSATSPTVVRTLLAVAKLPSVVDAPLHYALHRVDLAAGQSTSFVGAGGFVFVLLGRINVGTEIGGKALQGGEAAHIAAGTPATIAADRGEPAAFLHFLLGRADELNRSVETAPAVVSELYRTAAPLPGLKPGPYEFSLTRATFPPRFGLNPIHYRSGAALYFVIAGAGKITAEGKTEPRPAGAVQFEPYGFVHQWENLGDVPFVLIQANISQEGVPAVIMGRP